MADEDQWVAVFSDIPGNNLDEFVRCVCIEGPEEYQKNLSGEKRELHNSRYSHALLVDKQLRRAYVVDSELFEIAMGRYRMYIAHCVEEPEVMPEYIRKNLEGGNIDNLVESDLVFRASLSDFEKMEEEAERHTSTHVRVVLEEFKGDSDKNALREILSRAYEKDFLLFSLEQGQVVLKECAFFPFETAYYRNEPFGDRVRQFILWAILSQAVNGQLWLHYSKQQARYATTIQLLLNTGKQNADRFGVELLDWMENGMSVDGIDMQITPSLEDLLGEGSSKDDVIVPRKVVERVLVNGALSPHFIPSNCNAEQEKQQQ